MSLALAQALYLNRILSWRLGIQKCARYRTVHTFVCERAYRRDCSCACLQQGIESRIINQWVRPLGPAYSSNVTRVDSRDILSRVQVRCIVVSRDLAEAISGFFGRVTELDA